MTLRHKVMQKMNGVVAEHDAARRAVVFLLSQAERNQIQLDPQGPTFSELRTCLGNLERTYLVRLFALFEENLRDIWRDSFGKRTHPRTKELLDGCAARRSITPDRLLSDAHAARAYRNFIVHGTPAPVVALADAKSRLCRFLAWMPESW